MKSIKLGILLWGSLVSAQTVINGDRMLKGAWDATGAASTRPAKTGAVNPATCLNGELFFNAAAPAGQNLYLCHPDNTWTQPTATVATPSYLHWGYEVGSETTSAVALVTADLTSHGFVINSGNSATLLEASCWVDSASSTQAVTVKSGSTTMFTITCSNSINYSTTNGSAGYIAKASMTNSTLAAHTPLDLSGTANAASKDLKLHIYASQP